MLWDTVFTDPFSSLLKISSMNRIWTLSITMVQKLQLRETSQRGGLWVEVEIFFQNQIWVIKVIKKLNQKILKLP